VSTTVSRIDPLVSKRSRSSRPSGSTTQNVPAASHTESGSSGSSGSSGTAGTAGPAGRPDRTSAAASRSPGRSRLERYRGAIIVIAVGAVVLVGAAYLFVGAAQPAYACASVLTPAPSASPAPDATPRLGQVTRDMGRAHVETGSRVTYEFCPPTSGQHYNDARFGPIATRFYGPDDKTDPQGWVHNLEHGMMTVLYRCPEGCQPAAQDALRALQGELPASPLCGFPATSTVVVTRFDDLPTPYAAVVWGRAYFLDALDVAAITTFQQQSADRGPEPQCQNAVPGASPAAAPSPSAAPSASAAP
jgi:hypothetical protein